MDGRLASSTYIKQLPPTLGSGVDGSSVGVGVVGACVGEFVGAGVMGAGVSGAGEGMAVGTSVGNMDGTPVSSPHKSLKCDVDADAQWNCT